MNTLLLKNNLFLRTTMLWYYNINLGDNFLDVINPTEKELVLFNLIHGDDILNVFLTRLEKIKKDIKEAKYVALRKQFSNKRNKHVNKQKMNPYYQKEEWKK